MSGVRRLRGQRQRVVTIDLACNDPDNGHFASHFEMVQIEDHLELGLCRGHPPRLRDEGGELRCMRARFPYEHSKEWFGNWCWNRYWLRLDTAVDFIVKLHATKKWNADCATVPLNEWWDGIVLPAPLLSAWLQANPPDRAAA